MSLIENTNIDFEKVTELNLSGYKYVFQIKNKLRFFILDTLGYRKDWWQSFKKKKIAEQIEMAKIQDTRYSENSLLEINKKITGERNDFGFGFVLMHEIYYTNIMDLWLIIREYWDEDFKEIIGGEGKKSFYTRLEIVHRIRNKIMHSKPVMSHELRELKNFREYFNYILSKTGKDYSQFISYFPINDVLSNFKKELEQHKENYRNKSSENHFCSDVFDRSAVEWWWDSTLFSDYSLELTKYYDDVNEVNKSISDFENGIGKKFSIDSDIFSFKLPERCDSLLAKIQPHS